MKKRILSLMLMAALTLGTLSGCGSAAPAETSIPEESAVAATDAAPAEEAASPAETAAAEEAASEEATAAGEVLARIKETGKLVVGTASGYPPYEFVDITSADQKVIGIDMALAEAIAETLGVELVIEDMTFSALLASLPAKKIDLAIAGIAPTDERKETMDFSDSYLFAEQSFLILKSRAEELASAEAFNGQPLAAQKATTQERVCQDLYPDSQLVALDKVPDCIMELKSGKVAGVCIESIVGQQYVLSDEELTFSAADLGIKKETAIALEKGNEDLLEIINKVIADKMADGSFDTWIHDYSAVAAENAGN
ncbi:MAG: transporter substrate-binding domain-containing protein [Lachnospiraceae bacterium]|nr:transporter substrate-binding domain-containing protein [Lachnospiraceae bacterium]